MAVASALWAEEYSTYIKQQVEFHDLGAYDKDLTWDLNFLRYTVVINRFAI